MNESVIFFRLLQIMSAGEKELLQRMIRSNKRQRVKQLLITYLKKYWKTLNVV
ncbi:MAG: hypothetical protein GXO87_01815 [Chlorobi bacterium]|nr:hypothetical protein [Chlorobiota bacterium]